MAITEKTFRPVQSLTIPVHQDIPAKRFVGYAGTLTPDGGRAFGVTEAAWSADSLASAIVLGIALLEISGDCAAGDDIMSGANGIGKKATTGAIANGRALDGCTGGGIIRIKLVP